MSAVITTQAPRIGPFSIATRLATGGQASVYLAQNNSHSTLDARLVAVKTPRFEAATCPNSALRKEVDALTWVDHPHVVRLLEHNLTADPPYLVLEYVAGVDLHKLLKLSAPSRKGVPEALACYLCHHISSALHAIHAPGSRDVPRIYHGDVSPSNVLLSETGEVKLSDFGLSRLDGGPPSSDARPTNPPPGTPLWGHRGYLAPERLTGAPASAESDVFALGVMLGELLIGGPVFDGDGELARLISMKEGNLTPLMKRGDLMSPEILAICRACLEPNARSRPSAGELTRVLEARLRQDAMSAEQLSRSLSAWVTWAKRRAPSTAGAQEQLRESLQVMRASRGLSGPVPSSETDPGRAVLRAASTQTTQALSYSELVALAAAGKLDARDEVALFGNEFQTVSQIPALARHLIPSSTALTSEVSPLGPPDYCVDLSETSLITLLGRLLAKHSTGLLLVERTLTDHRDRKDIYVQDGRVTHISSTEPNDRLGEALIQSNVLTRQGLSAALRHMVRTQGQLGESLVALRLVDPVVVYQALCSQGRDRVVALCTWTHGTARFFSGVARPEVTFPLDVDLHVCLVQAVDSVSHAVPDLQSRVVPLNACPPPRSTPSRLPLLNLVPGIARKRVTVGTAIGELSQLSARGVTTSPATYLLVAHTLGWIDFS